MSMTHEERKKLRKRRQMKTNAVFLGIILLLVGLTVYLFILFPSTHFNQGVIINGLDVSRMSLSKAARLLEQKSLPELKLTVLGREGETLQVDGEDVDFGYAGRSMKEALKTIRKDQGFWSSLGSDESRELEIQPSINTNKLKRLLKGSAIAKADPVEPKDAYISRGEDNGFVIVPEVKGNELVSDDWMAYVEETVLEKLDSRQTEITVTIPDDFYVNTALPADDENLLETLNRLNEVAYHSLSVDMTGVTEKIYLKDVAVIGLDGRYTISEDLLRQRVHQLALDYDTMGCDRTIVLPDHRKITMKGSYEVDTYGFDLNEDQTYEILLNALNENKKKVKAKYYTIGQTRTDDGSLDIGGDYIFVDINRQKLYAVLDGKLLLSSDLVSGLESDPDRRTPYGIYGIWKMDTACSLVGTEANGTAWDSYVNYWMATDFHGNGLHDAVWREQFGKDIYKTDGSHGCVNLPYETAQLLYYNYNEGSPVLIYRSSQEESGSASGSGASSGNASGS